MSKAKYTPPSVKTRSQTTHLTTPVIPDALTPPPPSKSIEELRQIAEDPAISEFAESAFHKSNTVQPASTGEDKEIAVVPSRYYTDAAKGAGSGRAVTSMRIPIALLAELDYLVDNLPGARSKNNLVERYIQEGVQQDLKKLAKKP
ncbi:hypothetical protein [Chitinimonas sp. BJB300]|uniref:hypothetical protein n=1 Tax=Chitinimonas sp. BJB300 TaxID=1559339 RepID=UPI001111DA0A|nr:hypothetical protein [Chitinimonas sp. BJB300]TSJ84572.1 hypothetical protein FG002_019770 [Chitinimonas sp. BJB300]